MKSTALIFPMKDGGMINIDYDQESYPGCETCDYGSSYITDVEIQMTEMTIKIHSDNMYSFALSEGDLMKVILKNHKEIGEMTEKEFADWLLPQLKAATSSDKLEYKVE